MNSTPIRVLLIEDDEDDYVLTRNLLIEAGASRFQLEWVNRLGSGLTRIEKGGVDLILLDMSLPDSTGWETFIRAHGAAPQTPLILLTGLGDEVLGVRAVQEGAQDYLLKRGVTSDQLARSIRYAIERKRAEVALKLYRDRLEDLVKKRTAALEQTNLRLQEEIAETKRVQSELARLAAAVQQAAESIIITDAGGVIEYVNPSFERMTGYAKEEVIGKTPALLSSGKQSPAVYRDLWATISSGQVWRGHFIDRRKDGSLFEEEAVISPVRDPSGQIAHYVAVKRDVTQEALLQNQLRHSQKMEAIGSLAGGIAHDFTNMLLVITNDATRLKTKLPANAEWRSSVDRILEATNRASALTAQLMAFAHQRPTSTRLMDLNQVIAGTETMLRRTVGDGVRVELRLCEEPLPSRVDPAQIEEIIVHLAVNAREAMREGGEIRIESDHRILSPKDTSTLLNGFHAATEGSAEFALLSVIDNGAGMSPEIQSHIFEPFFTTKDASKATGLGLSTVYGIVKQHGGYIGVTSQPGAGSRFTVYLPMREADKTKFDAPHAVPAAHGENPT